MVVYAVKGFKGADRPIDNPLQIPAHKYSGNVLASGKEVVRTTPKFERGRLLGDVVFVSGTAAIKGENSEFSDDARVQAKEAIDVVEHLVEPSNISKDCSSFRFDLMRVYVRRPQDMATVRDAFMAHFGNISSTSSPPTSAVRSFFLNSKVSDTLFIEKTLRQARSRNSGAVVRQVQRPAAELAEAPKRPSDQQLFVKRGVDREC